MSVASESAGVRIEDYADMLRGFRALHLVGKGHKPATMPLTVPVLWVLEACRGLRYHGTVDPPTRFRQPVVTDHGLVDDDRPLATPWAWPRDHAPGRALDTS